MSDPKFIKFSSTQNFVDSQYLQKDTTGSISSFLYKFNISSTKYNVHMQFMCNFIELTCSAVFCLGVPGMCPVVKARWWAELSSSEVLCEVLWVCDRLWLESYSIWKDTVWRKIIFVENICYNFIFCFFSLCVCWGTLYDIIVVPRLWGIEKLTCTKSDEQ